LPVYHHLFKQRVREKVCTDALIKKFHRGDVVHSKQLEYFVTAAKKGSIASAARALNIAQPAVSQQLASLEREIKATLFNRSFAGITLTAAGEIFLTHAVALLEQIAIAKNAVSEDSHSGEKTIKIGVIPSIGNVVSLPLLTEMGKSSNKLKVEISTGPSYTIKDWLESKHIDIALTYREAVDEKSTHATPLIQEEMHVVFSASTEKQEFEFLKHRTEVSFCELREVPLLSPGTKDALGQLIAYYEQKTGVMLNHDHAYSGQLMTGLRQVINGEGVMILPTSAIFHLKESGLVASVKIIEPDMHRTVFAFTDKSTVNQRHVQTALGTIKKVVSAEHERQHWCGKLEFATTI
jgi:LysR family nitrogen assimilation transcriptional regulator